LTMIKSQVSPDEAGKAPRKKKPTINLPLNSILLKNSGGNSTGSGYSKRTDGSVHTSSTRTCSTAGSIISEDSTTHSNASSALIYEINSNHYNNGRIHNNKNRINANGWNQRQRSVHFAKSSKELAQVVAYVDCLEEMSAQERWDIWWSPQEYQAIRLEAKYIIRQIRKFNAPAIQAMERSLKSSRILASERTTATTMEEWPEDAFSQAMQNPAMCYHQKHKSATMEPWCTSKVCARGLEKFVSSSHKNERQQHLHDALQSVFINSRNSNDASCSIQGREERVSLVYQEHCRCAVLFARLMAHGDECAAQQAFESMPSLADDAASTASTSYHILAPPVTRRVRRTKSTDGEINCNDLHSSSLHSTSSGGASSDDNDSCCMARAQYRQSRRMSADTGMAHTSRRPHLHRQASLNSSEASPNRPELRRALLLRAASANLGHIQQSNTDSPRPQLPRQASINSTDGLSVDSPGSRRALLLRAASANLGHLQQSNKVLNRPQLHRQSSLNSSGVFPDRPESRRALLLRAASANLEHVQEQQQTSSPTEQAPQIDRRALLSRRRSDLGLSYPRRDHLERPQAQDVTATSSPDESPRRSSRRDSLLNSNMSSRRDSLDLAANNKNSTRRRRFFMSRQDSSSKTANA